MAVPNSDLPYKNQPVAGADAPGNRSVPASSYSNRPIPLAPRSADDLPEADDDDDIVDEDGDELRDIIKNAPAWLVSTVFHMVVLIVLGLLVVGSNSGPADLELDVGYTDDLGQQLEDPATLVNDTELEELFNDPIATPTDLPPVEDPLVAPPSLDDLVIAPGDTAEPLIANSAPVSGIALELSGRSAGSRQALLQKYGGTKGTEDAVELGLAWLARQQRSDGSWSLKGPYSDGSDNENTAAATAMALLAFQGHGDTHREGKYQTVVKKGWTALLKMQRKDGSFAGQMTVQIQQLYTHAQCTIAICELYGMTKDSRYRGPAQRAVKYCVESQDPQHGGWRYAPRQDSDTSVTGWFVMALQSARMAGLAVPIESLQKISGYLDSAALDDGRRYGYWRQVNVSSAMCAEGLLCRQYLGWPRDEPRLVEGVTALLDDPVAYGRGDNHDVYYWYYATQATHHMEGKIWEDWNRVMRREIPEHQLKKGPEAGSWDPGGDKWGYETGRLYVTCLSIYNLEVYYRHLPIYAGYSAIKALPPAPAAQEADDADAPTDDGDRKPADESDKAPPTESTPEKPDAGADPLDKAAGTAASAES